LFGVSFSSLGLSLHVPSMMLTGTDEVIE